MNPVDDLRNILDPGERMDTTTLYTAAAIEFVRLRDLVIDFLDAYSGDDHAYGYELDRLSEAVGR